MVRSLMVAFMVFAPMSSNAQVPDPFDLLREIRGQPTTVQIETMRQGHLNRYGDVQIHDNGTATIRGMQWMRCRLGMRWEPAPSRPTDGNCVGSTPLLANWAEANGLVKMMNDRGGFAGHADWRLPSIMELERLRLCSSGFTEGSMKLPDGTETFHQCLRSEKIESGSPTIGTQHFPNFWGSAFFTNYWSSSKPYAMSGDAWVVDFNRGNIKEDDQAGIAGILLVRGKR